MMPVGHADVLVLGPLGDKRQLLSGKRQLVEVV